MTFFSSAVFNERDVQSIRFNVSLPRIYLNTLPRFRTTYSPTLLCVKIHRQPENAAQLQVRRRTNVAPSTPGEHSLMLRPRSPLSSAHDSSFALLVST